MSIGFGNLGCAIFSAYPHRFMTRSTLNVQSGVRTSVANLVAGGLIILGSMLLKFNRIRTALLIGYACGIYWCFSIKLRQIKTYPEQPDRCSHFWCNLSRWTFILSAGGNFCRYDYIHSFVFEEGAEPELREFGYNEDGELAELSVKSKRPEPGFHCACRRRNLFCRGRAILRANQKSWRR